MTDETLISLDALEAEEAASAADAATVREDYNIQIVERELIIICSLILRAPEIIEPTRQHTETKNDTFLRLWRSFYDHSHRRNMAFAKQGKPPLYLGEEPLPDVCGKCFHTVGFCAGARIRFHCKRCVDRDVCPEELSLIYHSRYYYPNRICYTGHALPVFAQLIYKYYSPNGDPTWKMRSLMS